ncbi:MAG: helix-turn-helix domain-containing protein [Candidatus Heimdallarchaeota archaeon]|nr:helix-turn-helix domain-containing protein [Candidatus Heimdallarchaeota archaeon]
MQDLEIDQVLEILSNGYRREILRFLTIEDRYAFELSKLLEISQRAVTKHLKSLKEANLVYSKKIKSKIGPAREYFSLNKAVILSFTIAPNLFRASIRALHENDSFRDQIIPSLQLGESQESGFNELLEKGMRILPEIREGLDLLQIQQNKLLRAYQGMQNHLYDILTKNSFNQDEIRLILFLLENEGEVIKNEIEISLGPITKLTETLNNLEEKNIIKTEIFQDDKGLSNFRVTLNNQINQT